MSKRTEFKPATLDPCAACPWRESNHGKRHPGGWYTKRNLRRLWARLRRGDRMSCHPTDPDNPVPEGWPEPKPGHTRECAGSLILVQREAQRLNDTIMSGGDLKDYWAANPLGLTRVGAAVVISNVQWSQAFPEMLEMAKPNLDTPGIGCPGVVPWQPRTSE